MQRIRPLRRALATIVAVTFAGSLGWVAARAQSSNPGDGAVPLHEHQQTGGGARIRVLSSRNDLVTGGDALVQVERAAPRGGRLSVAANGRDVTRAFRPGPTPGTLRG